MLGCITVGTQLFTELLETKAQQGWLVDCSRWRQMVLWSTNFFNSQVFLLWSLTKFADLKSFTLLASVCELKHTFFPRFLFTGYYVYIQLSGKTEREADATSLDRYTAATEHYVDRFRCSGCTAKVSSSAPRTQTTSCSSVILRRCLMASTLNRPRRS